MSSHKLTLEVEASTPRTLLNVPPTSKTTAPNFTIIIKLSSNAFLPNFHNVDRHAIGKFTFAFSLFISHVISYSPYTFPPLGIVSHCFPLVFTFISRPYIVRYLHFSLGLELMVELVRSSTSTNHVSQIEGNESLESPKTHKITIQILNSQSVSSSLQFTPIFTILTVFSEIQDEASQSNRKTQEGRRRSQRENGAAREGG